MKKLILILTACLTLQSCIFAVGAAAGAVGAAVVYDHRKMGEVARDQKIMNDSVDALHAYPNTSQGNHINVTSFKQVVLITGQVHSDETRTQVGNIINNIPNVTQTYNQLTVRGPISSLTRTGDAWITAKIKTKMLSTKDLKSSSIKVITENSAVYLMGTVTHEQADGAADIAREVAGVQKVIKVFKYTD